MSPHHSASGEAARPPGILAVAFEGCGCRAAFHVGVIEWFTEHGVEFGAVAGGSSGSLIAAATAIGRVPDLRAAWMTLLGTPVFDVKRVLKGRWPFRMTEIVHGAATAYFGDRLLCDTLIPLAIVVTTLGRGGLQRRSLTARDRLPLRTAILASCFIPGPYSRMVPIGGRPTFDGAWLGRVPIREAADLGATRVVACVADDEGRLLRGAWPAKPMAAPAAVDCRVLAPITPLPLRTFDFDRAATIETFAIGRASAERFAAVNGEWLLGATRPRETAASRPTPSGAEL